ncbi:MAG: hypothetical protein O7D94_03305, partial [Planctomycetota bacterium]|nr:hypothetical protein [Planctomycetota bacterium]
SLSDGAPMQYTGWDVLAESRRLDASPAAEFPPLSGRPGGAATSIVLRHALRARNGGTPTLRQRYNSPMPRPSRVRGIAKWVVLWALVVTVGGTATSAHRSFFYNWWNIAESRGELWFHDCGLTISWQPASPSINGRPPPGLMMAIVGSDQRTVEFAFPSFRSDSCWNYAYVPMWLPLLGLAIPTAILWHRDRRTVKPGHCLHCGYNQTGADHEKCPECGTPITRKPRQNIAMRPPPSQD